MWAAGICTLGKFDGIIFNSIDKWFNYLLNLKCDVIVYFHNLKFDGAFIIDYFIKKGFKDSYIPYTDVLGKMPKKNEIDNCSYTYSISGMGQWYYIVLKIGDRYIEFRDSLKLLPFRVKTIGKDFKTKYQKLEIEYVGERHENGYITEEEKEYLLNDLYVISEALNIFIQEHGYSLTIGSACLKEWKRGFDKSYLNSLLPDLTKIMTPIEGIDYDTFIRKSYRGGWCYVAEEYANQTFYNGCTLDVNSLYPSMMHSCSRNYYPVGEPHYFKGKLNINTFDCQENEIYYFIHFKCKLKLKKGYLPFIQNKHTLSYAHRQMITTSDVWNPIENKYQDFYYDIDGNKHPAMLELTMTCTDFKLMFDHYDVEYIEYIDGCYFDTIIGLFDEYIDKFMNVKKTSEGAKRAIAKLFLNNLYGKLASGTDSTFYRFVYDDEQLHLRAVPEHSKKAGYIPIGSAITSYARDFTIRHAQANYNTEFGSFIYGDTDSLHLNMRPEHVRNCVIHSSDMCCWKIEKEWNYGVFIRPKTYIEIEENDIDIKCAGLPDKCKNLFLKSCGYDVDVKIESEKEKEFLKTCRTLKDFKIGLTIPGKLRPKRIDGGIVLVDTDYTMR